MGPTFAPNTFAPSPAPTDVEAAAGGESATGGDTPIYERVPIVAVGEPCVAEPYEGERLHLDVHGGDIVYAPSIGMVTNPGHEAEQHVIVTPNPLGHAARDT